MTLAEAAAAPPVDEPLHRRLGVTDDELAAIRDRLGGRDPNDLELAMFSVMWSEHCSYKSSRPLLRTLPTGATGDALLAGPGENAGVVSIGDGLAVAFKIESHNHPSAVEPYQGAATGVGGILRDIFTMGARPIAVLDALRFGDPSSARTRHLVDGVVRGVGGYGNCVGVPTVGGELVFDPSYEGNPLVNVMAIGLLEERLLTRAAAPGPGNLVVLFGSTTGRDGIGGASRPRVSDVRRRRPLEAAERPGRRPVRGEAPDRGVARADRARARRGAPGPRRRRDHLRDLRDRRPRRRPGCGSSSTAIPRREPGMDPFEVMISESQERMLAVVRPDRRADVEAVCRRWGLPVAVIGRVTDDGDIVIVDGDAEIARIPAAALTSDAIVHERRGRAAAAPPGRARAGRPGRGRAGRRPAGAGHGPGRRPARAPRLARTSPRATRSSSSTTRRSRRTPSRVPGTARRSSASRGRRRRSSPRPTRTRRSARSIPWLGAALSVAEATRNVSITGARPLGVTNCLNYGDPTQPDAFWQLERGRPRARRRVPGARPAGHRRQRLALQRVADAAGSRRRRRSASSGCSRTSRCRVGPAFAAAGDAVLLVGEAAPGLAGSEYAALAGIAAEDGPPGARPRDGGADPGVRPRGGGARPARDRPGRRRAAASRSRSRRRRSGPTTTAGSARRSGCRSRTRRRSTCSARAPRGSSSRAGRATRPARDAARPPARPRGRGAGHGRRRAARRRARGRRRDRRRGGARQPRRRRARRRGSTELRHAWDTGLTAGARLGERARCAACSGRSSRPAAGTQAAAIASLGLFALQHRGQESAGVAVSDGEQLMLYKDLGMISSVLDERRIPSFRGDLAIAHCRYSTTGSTVWENAQPTFRLGPRRALAIGHNGNLVNTRELLGQLERRPRPAAGLDRHGAPDRAARRRAGDRHRRRARPGPAAGPRRVHARRPRRATGDRRPRPVRLPAARARPAADRRRLAAATRTSLWRRRRAHGWCLSSETAGLDIVGAEYVRDVEPGEIVILEPGRAPRSVRYAPANPALCVFELIYFARPDSYMEGRNLYEVRRRMGEQLALEHPADADLVMPVPDTGARGRGRLRRGVRDPVPRGPRPQPLHAAGRSSSRPRRCASGA